MSTTGGPSSPGIHAIVCDQIIVLQSLALHGKYQFGHLVPRIEPSDVVPPRELGHVAVQILGRDLVVRAMIAAFDHRPKLSIPLPWHWPRACSETAWLTGPCSRSAIAVVILLSPSIPSKRHPYTLYRTSTTALPTARLLPLAARGVADNTGKRAYRRQVAQVRHCDNLRPKIGRLPSISYILC